MASSKKQSRTRKSKAKAKAAAKTKREIKGKTERKTERKTKSKAKSNTKAKARAKPGNKAASARTRKVKSKVKTKNKSKKKTNIKPKTKVKTKAMAKRKVASKAAVQAAPKREAAPKAGAQPDVTPSVKPKPVAKPRSAPRPEAAAKPAPETTPEVAPMPRPVTVHLFAIMLAGVQAAAAAVLGPQAALARIVVEPPRDPAHGDMATNAAMVLAKDAAMKPRELADRLAEALRADSLVATVDVAGPGFINLTLKAHVWGDALRAVLEQGEAYGQSDLGAGHKVNVEYVSANPTGPLHVGHGRGAVFGDALASLLGRAGFDVTREYYINDAGAQVDVLARSAHLRYREALGEAIGEIPEGLYPGDYLIECGQELAADFGDKLTTMAEAEWLPIVRRRAIDMMMAEIRNDLAALRIVPDVFYSERSLIDGEEHDPFAHSHHLAPSETAKPASAARSIDVVAATIADLRAMGHVYEGRLPPPKSGNLEDWEDREQTLFRSTDFGDDVDRPLLKSDGSYTYFATDIAYHKSKFDRGFTDMIDVWGADHGGYVKRMQAAVKAVSAGQAVLDVKLVQLVRLLRAGEPVKMSKRAGSYVTLREVVDEVGRSAVRFDMLYRKNDAVLDFDLAKVIEASRDNPVFYVQYGHARGYSIFRTAKAELGDALPDAPAARLALLKKAPLERLTDPGELSILRKLALYPRLIEAAASAHEPHRVAFYLYELASEFHGQWSRGKDSSHLRFIIQDDRELTLARLALVQGVVTVLASGLALLGVDAPDEMR